MPPVTYKKEYIYDNLARSFIVAAFLYSCIRAYFLSITHDEAITYLIHSLGSFSEIFTYALSHKSNNHLLNTLLIKVFINLFGVSEFVMRIPALIGHGLYLIAVYKILKLFLTKRIFFLGILLLISHPFMLDFFSCARGYSLGLGFLMFGLYYLFKRIKEPGLQDVKNTTLASIMLGLSMLSVPFVGAFFPIIGIFTLLGFKKGRFTKVLFPIVAAILLLLAIYGKALIEMARKEEIYYGSAEGFWKNTMTSLIKASLYDRNYFDLNMLLAVKLLIIALLIFSALLLLYKLFTKQKFELIDKYLFWVTVLLFISPLSIVLLHNFFNTKYVIGRTAIYFIPIFSIFILILWKSIKSIRIKLIGTPLNILFYLFVFILLIHFINCANFTHYLVWKYDASTKDMVNYLIEINKNNDLKPGSVHMGADWIFEPSINFYIEKNGLMWMRYVQREDFDYKYDYYYFVDKKLIDKYNLKVVKRFDVSDTYLAVP